MDTKQKNSIADNTSMDSLGMIAVGDDESAKRSE